METTFIYALCEPGTRTVRYIGKANDPKRRFHGHLQKSVKLNTHLGSWLRSLNEEKPALVILREVPIEQWELAEERYIRLARGLGMRIVNGSDGGGGITFTPEVKAKMSAAKKGVPLSPEHCAAISAAQKGVPRSPECCAAISAARKGMSHSPETRSKISAARTGPLHPMFGRRLPPETCAKISAGNTGKKRSSETCAKNSAAQMLVWARRKAGKAAQV